MSNYPSLLSLFLPGQHVSTGDVGKTRPLRERKGRERKWRERKGGERKGRRRNAP